MQPWPGRKKKMCNFWKSAQPFFCHQFSHVAHIGLCRLSKTTQDGDEKCVFFFCCAVSQRWDSQTWSSRTLLLWLRLPWRCTRTLLTVFFLVYAPLCVFFLEIFFFNVCVNTSFFPLAQLWNVFRRLFHISHQFFVCSVFCRHVPAAAADNNTSCITRSANVIFVLCASSIWMCFEQCVL